MIRIQHSLVVGRAIETVFTYVSNLENMPAWGTAVSVTKADDGPVSVGTRFREEAEFRGRKMELDDEVIEFEPNRTFTVRTTSSMMESTSRITFSPGPGRAATRLDYVIEARAHGVVRLLLPLLAPRIKKQFLADVANLKQVLEFGRPAGWRAAAEARYGRVGTGNGVSAAASVVDSRRRRSDAEH
jgi:uncharacterized membrane protein